MTWPNIRLKNDMPVRVGTCLRCGGDNLKLYIVRCAEMCAPCGHKEIAAWNAAVRGREN